MIDFTHTVQKRSKETVQVFAKVPERMLLPTMVGLTRNTLFISRLLRPGSNNNLFLNYCGNTCILYSKRTWSFLCEPKDSVIANWGKQHKWTVKSKIHLPFYAKVGLKWPKLFKNMRFRQISLPKEWNPKEISFILLLERWLEREAKPKQNLFTLP